MNNKMAVTCGMAFLTLIISPRLGAAPAVTIDDSTESVTVVGTGFNTVSIPFVGTFQLFQTGHFADANGNSLPEAVWFAGLGGNLTTATINGLWTEQSGDPDAPANSDRFFIQTTAPGPVAPAVTIGVFLSDPNLLPSVTIPSVNLVVGTVSVPIFGGMTIDFNLLGAPVVSAEPNRFTNISPSDGLTVNARSDVGSAPENTNTLGLLALALVVLTGAGRFGARARTV